MHNKMWSSIGGLLWAVVVFVIAFAGQYVILYRWRNPKCCGILPPGSSGLPFIGESIQLMKPFYSFGTPPFISHRVKKYGSLFRTNIAGRHLIISTDPVVNSYIFQQEGKLVELWYLNSFDNIIHSSAPNDIHKYLRGLTQRQFGGDNLKQKLLFQFQELASKTFQIWSTQDLTQVKSSSNKAFIEMGAKITFGCDPIKSAGLADKFTEQFVKGLMCFPLNIPGTTYHNVIKIKKELMKTLSETVRERLSSPSSSSSSLSSSEDMLDVLVKEMKNVNFLTEEFLVDAVFGLTFGTFVTTSLVFALAVKFISENPAVLRDLTDEHEKILERKEDKNSPITWDEYKSMSFTLQVIKETMRIGSTLPGVFRKAKKDFVINGYTIPKGWGIIAAYIHGHYDPTLFKDPYEFNPWRWKDIETDASKYFNPFGGGIRQCVGAEYARVILAIFIHAMVTKYRWEVIGGGDIVQAPLIQFKNDLCIKFSKKSD